MRFMPIQSILDGKYEDKSVAIRGWVYRKREGKQTIFLVVRDSTGVIQCTVKADSPAWSEAEKITIESSLTIEGTVKKDQRAPGGYEVSAEKLSVIGLADVFPISKDKSEEFLRDIRHLWLRSRRMNLVMKVRADVLEFTREFFKDQGFVEVSPPMFISAAVEGGSTLFGLKYFDQNLYLTQSSQLYLEILIYSLEKVYCIAPSFRAEKSRTIRHLTEYWHIEGEWPFADMNDLMQFEEELLAHVCKRAAEKCGKEFEELGADTSKVASVETPFPKITYTEAVERLKAKGIERKWGEDFGYDDEKALADEFGKPFFVYDYPTAIKAFYCKTYRNHPEVAMSADMLVPRIGEISTGGAREDDKDVLIKRIREMGLSEKDYDWYLDLRRYGTVPHVGFGMGLERLLTWMLDLENIIDSIPFPRTIRRFYP
ncbi:asparagine--tRNA ligase [Candidatus Bathyarchaeota archaeon CG07_land_8_20_14_0_80_47_9]|nr:MAG: asparagine--tRNA ligase [Candidatus Bathyarchaeota archaeon CG07_land_8_20_14_0_80_47_9]